MYHLSMDDLSLAQQLFVNHEKKFQKIIEKALATPNLSNKIMLNQLGLALHHAGQLKP